MFSFPSSVTGSASPCVVKQSWRPKLDLLIVRVITWLPSG
jgi:hypothetical protein